MHIAKCQAIGPSTLKVRDPDFSSYNTSCRALLNQAVKSSCFSSVGSDLRDQNHRMILEFSQEYHRYCVSVMCPIVSLNMS